MSQDNPYLPPESDVGTGGALDSGALAGRWQRLGAVFVDGLLVGVIQVPLLWLTGFGSVYSGQASVGTTVLSAVLGVVITLAINFHFLDKYGQTVGKKSFGIRIADLEGNKAPISTIILKRFLPVWVVSLIPIAGAVAVLIDVLLIFRSDKRCVHDLIAGTQVLRV